MHWALEKHIPGVIQTYEDFQKYPWDEILDRFFQKANKQFQCLREAMPDGMKAIGGAGSGVFELVQDLMGYMSLCYIREDDSEFYVGLLQKVGDVSVKNLKRLLNEYSDIFCVLRFGDDLGFKSNTLLSAEGIRDHIIPYYKRIIYVVYAAGNPFLLHSCGSIFEVMDDLIATGIDAKHSNEDQIALFPEWVTRYGDKIGNFSGIDIYAVCRLGRQEMREYISDVVKQCRGQGGFAFGSGNSIPPYVFRLKVI